VKKVLQSSQDKYKKILSYKYKEWGSGKPVLLLHGLFGGSSNWAKVQKKLAQNFRLIAIDFPYLEVEKELCSIDFFTDYLKHFLSYLGIEKASFIGNSLGGHLALNLAVKESKKVESLVLAGSSGLFERTYNKDLQVHPTKSYLRKKIGEIFYDKNLVSSKMVDEAYRLILDKNVKRRVIRLSKSAKNHNMEALLNKIKCPTLLIWGESDIITPKEVAYIFKNNIKKSKLVFLDKCCHAPMMEQPQAFADLSMKFLLNSKDDTYFSSNKEK